MADKVFDLIGKIIKLIGLRSFQSLLWGKVKEAFHESFESTQAEFDFQRTKSDPEVIEYLKTRQFILSKKTVDRLHGDLKLNLLEGIRAGDSIKELMKRIEPIFDRMKNYELERLARTETINAMNVGRLNAYEKSGVVKYVQWKAHKDARTSDICRRLDGQIIRLGEELFTDPVTGEQFRNPPAHPNCRSTIIPLRKLPEITYNSGYRYVAKIEIDIGSLEKQEKYKKRVLVHRRGQRPFYREQLVGRKEPEKKERIFYRVTGDHDIDKSISFTLQEFDESIGKGLSKQEAVYRLVDSKSQIEYTIEKNKLTVEREPTIMYTMYKLSNLVADSMKPLVNGVHILVGPDIIRTHHSGDVIYVAKSRVSSRIIFHEFGHHIEDNKRTIHRACVKFLDNRTKDEKEVKLDDLFPGLGYRDDEIAKPDKFIHPYVGKIYPYMAATEVISKGIEKFESEESLEDFYNADREHFGLVLACIAGRI